eukprot:Colp12_sorted_trinity150504_noHs@29981
MSSLLRHLASSRQLVRSLVCETVMHTQTPVVHANSIFLLRLLSTQSKRPSLASRAADFPDVISQWHPHKNMVGPDGVAPCSNKRFWFMCDEGHEWEAILYNRTK